MRLPIAAALGSLMISPAIAADIDMVPEPVAIYDWSGFYIGANGGYGWGTDESVNLSTDDITPLNLGDSTTESRGTIGDLSLRGWFGGAQAGYNFQTGMMVFGLEGDIQAANLDDDRSAFFTNPSGTQPILGEAELDVDWFGTVRARLGAALDRTLLYITGGVAFGGVDYELQATEAGGFPLFETHLESSDTEVGWVAGAGIEHAFSENWTIKLEYQFIDLGNVDADAPVTNIGGGPTGENASSDIDVKFHTVRGGINFKF